MRNLIADVGLRLPAVERRQLWFPLLDPLLFRLGHHANLPARQSLLHVLRTPKVPIPCYYSLEAVLER